MMFKLNCIKCQKPYESLDPEPYYCLDCKEEKNKIAKEIDKKFASIPKEPVESELARYDRLRGKSSFVSYKLFM